MWIVHLALRRPYTFVVFSVLVMILGALAAVVTPKDIFPYINIPVVSVVWIYNGLTPEEMEKRVMTICERGLTTTVNDIEHIESQSYQGVAVVRVYFQPNVKVELALAQITAPRLPTPTPAVGRKGRCARDRRLARAPGRGAAAPADREA